MQQQAHHRRVGDEGGKEIKKYSLLQDLSISRIKENSMSIRCQSRVVNNLNPQAFAIGNKLVGHWEREGRH